MPTQGIRINKFLSESGVCSRREADRLIEEGKLTKDGIPIPVGYRVMPQDCICLNGKQITRKEPVILLAFHKPRGVVCTTSKCDKNNIVDYIHYDRRIYPVGRLDKESEGLILMTNQGELMDNILRGRNHHEKEYLVWLDRPVSDEIIQKMQKGVPILNTVTRPCEITRVHEKAIRIILTQGLNRQIRRMCEYYQLKVTRLKRIRIMNIELGNLRVGEYRSIEGDEWKKLMDSLKS